MTRTDLFWKICCRGQTNCQRISENHKNKDQRAMQNGPKLVKVPALVRPTGQFPFSCNFLTAILLTALCSGLNLFILGGLAAPRFCNKLDSATQNAPKYRKIKGLLGGAEVCPPNSSVSAKGATFSEMPLTSGFLAHVPRCDRPCCPFPAGLGRCTMNRVYRLVGPM